MALIRHKAKLPDSDFNPNANGAGHLINHPTALRQSKLEVGGGVPQRQGQSSRCERQQQDKAIKLLCGN